MWYSCDYTVVNSEPVRVKSEREALVRLYSSQSKPARVCVCGAAEESVSESVRVGVRQCWKVLLLPFHSPPIPLPLLPPPPTPVYQFIVSPSTSSWRSTSSRTTSVGDASAWILLRRQQQALEVHQLALGDGGDGVGV